MSTADGREYLASLLPKSAHKHISDILDAFAVDDVTQVEIIGARVPVELVNAYGLDIEVDANGNAVTVAFPHKAEVTW